MSSVGSETLSLVRLTCEVYQVVLIATFRAFLGLVKLHFTTHLYMLELWIPYIVVILWRIMLQVIGWPNLHSAVWLPLPETGHHA